MESGVRERERGESGVNEGLGHGTGRISDWRFMWIELVGSAQSPGLGATGVDEKQQRLYLLCVFFFFFSFFQCRIIF